MQVRARADQVHPLLLSLPGIHNVTIVQERDGIARFEMDVTHDDADLREALFRAVSEAGHPILELTARHDSLENLFVRITSRDATDGAKVD